MYIACGVRHVYIARAVRHVYIARAVRHVYIARAYHLKDSPGIKEAAREPADI